MNSLGVIGWFLNNHLLRRKKQSLRQVLFYDRFVIPLLRSIEGIVKIPIGLSIVVVGRKEG